MFKKLILLLAIENSLVCAAMTDVEDLQGYVTRLTDQELEVIEQDAQCAICLENLKAIPSADVTDRRLLVKTNCPSRVPHVFHEDCMLEVLDRMPVRSCPSCRGELRLREEVGDPESARELWYHVYSNNIAEVERLLQNGLNVNSKNEYGDCALHVAVNQNLLPMTRLLLRNGARVNSRNRYYGDTALMRALDMQPINLDMINFLLDHGANINVRNSDGDTVLIKASRNGSLEVVRLLLDRGANVNKIGSHNTTALIEACDKEDQNLEIITLLLDRGADVNSENNFGLTASFYCMNNLELVRLLLSRGANIDFDLGLQVLPNNIENIQFCLEHGANINIIDEDGGETLLIDICDHRVYRDGLDNRA